MHGKQYEGKTILAIDPHGAPYVYPEEISLETYNENKQGIWTAFHYTSEYANGAATGAQKHEVVSISSSSSSIRKSIRAGISTARP